MVAMAKQPKLYTVRDAADALGVTGGRVRQLVVQHDIGEIYGNTRLLTEEDLRKLKQIPRVMGRPKKSQNVA
jgi:hypothetical protein